MVGEQGWGRSCELRFSGRVGVQERAGDEVIGREQGKEIGK
jgi:hypothetical protein